MKMLTVAEVMAPEVAQAEDEVKAAWM